MGGLLQDLHCAQGEFSPYNGAFESPAQSWAVIQSIQNTMGRHRIERNCTLFLGPSAICSIPAPSIRCVSLVTHF